MCLVKYFIHYPANLGNHKGVFPHQFHFFFLLEGGERMNENANKLYQGISKHFFSSSIGKANAWYPTATNYFHVSLSEVNRTDDRSLGLKPGFFNQVCFGWPPPGCQEMEESVRVPDESSQWLLPPGRRSNNHHHGHNKTTTVTTMVYRGRPIF